MRNDKTKIILKGKPQRTGSGMYFTGYVEIGGMLIGISITQTADGRVVYDGEKGPFVYASVTAGKKTMQDKLIKRRTNYKRKY
jgi:hypothetical protein